jgi:hypothetical protein
MGNNENYNSAKFGDKRLDKRMSRLLEQLRNDPSASISAACKDPYQAKAAYRFTLNDNVTVGAITEITRDVTIENIIADSPSVLLIPQDTTEFSYKNLKSTEGLGNVGTGKSGRGIVAHSAIAVSDVGMVYGLMSQKIWVRPLEEYGKSNNRDKLPIEEKESYKWLETIECAEPALPEGTLVVHVCDREGDIYEFFCKASEEGINYLCRRWQNRKVESENDGERLNEFVCTLPEAGKIIVHVPRDSHSNRIARDAELEIKYSKCKIMKPSNLSGNKNLPKSVEVYVVSAVETAPPPGQAGISWLLITNVPTESFEDAVERIQWYTQRWKIEIFHRTLKSGCKVEELQSETADKLMKLIAIYSIIALEIMSLSYLARTRPDESCEICLTEDEWKILYRVVNKTKDLPEKVPTVYEAVIMVAKLGGFLARKSDGFPGVTVIWRGLTKFYTILDAVPFFV